MKTPDDVRLCETCRGLDVRALLIASEAQKPPKSGDSRHLAALTDLHAGVSRFYAQYDSLTSLRESSVNCDLCCCIWQQYSAAAHPLELTTDALDSGLGSQQIYLEATQWDRSLHGLPHIVACQYGPRGETRNLAWFEPYAERGCVPSSYSHLIGRSTFGHSGSDVCLATARDMLRNCLEHHVSCNNSKRQTSRAPTRMLQIDVLEGPVQLIDSDGKVSSFVALSYCWGGERKLTLTQQSEHLLREGLPIDTFPATLRDAFIVTKELGFSFIWIDALCIFQDSEEDWKFEASRMRDVYKGAVVMLNAAAAAKTSDGMLTQRPSPGPRCKLHWHCGKATNEYVYLRPGSEFSDMTLRTSHTATRSWTLQEGLLAPRTLHFGSQQIAFECIEGRVDEAGRHTKATEEYSNKAFMQGMYNEKRGWRTASRFARSFGIPPVVHVPYYSLRNLLSSRSADMSGLSAKSYASLHFQGVLKTPAGMAFTHYDQWREIVKNYTSRKLTVESDVLPALAGLANEFNRVTGGDAYIAGMWRGDLVRSLNWVRGPLERKVKDGKIIDVRLPKEYLAPSWSWASILGRSTMFVGSSPCQDETTLVPRVKVLEIYLETDKTGPFGKVKTGYLRLSGPVLDIDNPLLTETDHSRLPAIHRHLTALINDTYELGCEFLQKHAPFDGQRFCLLHLCDDRDLSDHFRRKSFLLLESCPGRCWKRVGNFGLRKNGPMWKKQKLELPPDPDEHVRLELEKVKWVNRIIEII